MRIVMVWVTCLIVCAVITVSWYVSNTAVNTIASGNMDLIGTSGEGYSLLKLLEYVNIAWGPILDALVILWALANSAYKDVRSDLYG